MVFVLIRKLIDLVLTMKSIVVRYSLLLFFLLAILKGFEYAFFSHRISLDLYLGLTALAFLIIGAFAVRYWWPRIEAEKTPKPEPDQTMWALLSEREKELLPLLAQGYTNEEIASLLNVSTNTIKTHLKNLFNKLQVSNRTQAVAEAKLLNLI